MYLRDVLSFENVLVTSPFISCIISLPSQQINEFAKATNLNQRYIAKFIYDGKILLNEQRQQYDLRNADNPFQRPMSNEDIANLQTYIKNQYFNARMLRLKLLRQILVIYDSMMPREGNGNSMVDEEESEWSEDIRTLMKDVVTNLFNSNIISTLYGAIHVLIHVFYTLFSIQICS